MGSPAGTIPSSWLSEIRDRSFDTADSRHSQTFKLGILSLFTVGLFWYAGVEECFRPMWLDEYLTLWLTQIPGGSAFWTAFFSGAENNPPFYFVAARAASQLLGPSSFALRLPSLLGFWLMCLGLNPFSRDRRIAPTTRTASASCLPQRPAASLTAAVSTLLISLQAVFIGMINPRSSEKQGLDLLGRIEHGEA